MVVREGETFIPGTDAATARKLIEAAKKKGHSTRVVRVEGGGFVVPSDLVDAHILPAKEPEKKSAEEAEKKPARRRKSTTTRSKE